MARALENQCLAESLRARTPSVQPARTPALRFWIPCKKSRLERELFPRIDDADSCGFKMP
jgi:hypothetical protein